MHDDGWFEEESACDGSTETRSPSGQVCIREWPDRDLISVGLLAPAGTMYAVRTSDGSVSTVFIWEERELWYSSVTVMAVQDQPYHRHARLGPFLTSNEASDAAGEWSGDVAGEVSSA